MLVCNKLVHVYSTMYLCASAYIQVLSAVIACMHYEDGRRHFYHFSSYLLLGFLTLIPSKMLLMVLLSLGMFMMLGKRLININQELKCSLWYVIY